MAERVDFDLDNTPLQGERLAMVALALEAIVASPSFVVDCYLVGADPNKAPLHLEPMQESIKTHRSLVL